MVRISRTKLKKPVSNKREAFCSRGCGLSPPGKKVIAHDEDIIMLDWGNELIGGLTTRSLLAVIAADLDAFLKRNLRLARVDHVAVLTVSKNPQNKKSGALPEGAHVLTLMAPVFVI